MLDICEKVFVDVQGLIRIFDQDDGTVRLIQLKDSRFCNLLPRVGFLKASANEAPYIDVDELKKFCCAVVTNGKDGCTLYYRDDEQQIAPFQSVQVDPTGGGIVFWAALLLGLRRGWQCRMMLYWETFLDHSPLGKCLPKFDSDLLQMVKVEVHRKRLQLLDCHEPEKYSSIFMKPLDQENLRTALSTTKSLHTHPTQKGQVGLPSLPKAGSQNNFRASVFDEQILSGDEMP